MRWQFSDHFTRQETCQQGFSRTPYSGVTLHFARSFFSCISYSSILRFHLYPSPNFVFLNPDTPNLPLPRHLLLSLLAVPVAGNLNVSHHLQLHPLHLPLHLPFRRLSPLPRHMFIRPLNLSLFFLIPTLLYDILAESNTSSFDKFDLITLVNIYLSPFTHPLHPRPSLPLS